MYIFYFYFSVNVDVHFWTLFASYHTNAVPTYGKWCLTDKHIDMLADNVAYIVSALYRYMTFMYYMYKVWAERNVNARFVYLCRISGESEYLCKRAILHTLTKYCLKNLQFIIKSMFCAFTFQSWYLSFEKAWVSGCD